MGQTRGVFCGVFLFNFLEAPTNPTLLDCSFEIAGSARSPRPPSLLGASLRGDAGA